MRLIPGLLTLLVCFSSYAERPPIHDLELGFTFGQRARVLSGAEIAWADYELIKRRYPPLRAYSNTEINETLLRSYAYLTDLQFNYLDIFMEVKGQTISYRSIYHPRGYVRGSVSSLLLPGKVAETGLYPVDLKGTGISPEGEVRLFTLKEMYLALKGEKTHILNFATDGSMLHIQETLKAHVNQKSSTEEKLRKSDLRPEQTRSYQHSIYQSQLQIEAYQFFLDNIKKGGTAEQKKQRATTFLNMIRRMDYTHGLMPLERSMKEVIMQRGMQTLFDSYPEDLRTIESYFVIALPVYILGPNGVKTRASIIGRMPHLRSDSKKAHEEYTAGLPSNIIQPVLAGGLQFSVGGKVVDFELPSITHPAVPELAYDTIKGHPIEVTTRKAAEAFEAGNKLACFDVVNKALAPLAGTLVLARQPNAFALATDQWEDFCRHNQNQDPALFQHFQENIKPKFTDPEKLIAFLMPMLDSRPELLGAILEHEINTFLTENPPNETKEYFSKANQALKPWVDPIYSLAQLSIGGTSKFSPILARVMAAYSKFPRYHSQLIQDLGPELLRMYLAQSTAVGMIPGEAFDPSRDEEGWSQTFVRGTAMYSLAATAINTVSILLMRMKEVPDDKQPSYNVTINMGDKSIRFSKLMKTFAQDSALYRGILKVAQGLSGLTIPPDMHAYFLSEADPASVQRLRQEEAIEAVVSKLTQGICTTELTEKGLQALIRNMAEEFKKP